MILASYLVASRLPLSPARRSPLYTAIHVEWPHQHVHLLVDTSTWTQLRSDESPLSSLDSGMGDNVEAEGQHPTPNKEATQYGDQDLERGAERGADRGGDRGGVEGMNIDTLNVEPTPHRKFNEARFEEQQLGMVALYGAPGMGLAMPPDGGIPLLQVGLKPYLPCLPHSCPACLALRGCVSQQVEPLSPIFQPYPPSLSGWLPTRC